MVRRQKDLFLLVLSLAIISPLASCSKDKTTVEPGTSNKPNGTAQQSPRQTQPTQQQKTEPGTAVVGEASGNYTAEGEVVQLKYAYAGRGLRFGKVSVIILVTDKPIPPESLAEELKSQTMFYDKKIRGLEYVIEDEGYWVRFHPSQYQESKGGHPKEYSVENDIVRGLDEDDGDVTSGKYTRSVRFAATITKSN